jgi:hypothetical protein
VIGGWTVVFFNTRETGDGHSRIASSPSDINFDHAVKGDDEKDEEGEPEDQQRSRIQPFVNLRDHLKSSIKQMRAGQRFPFSNIL